MGSKQLLPLRIRVDLWVITMKEYSRFLKALDWSLTRWFSIISRTLIFFNPSAEIHILLPQLKVWDHCREEMILLCIEWTILFEYVHRWCWPAGNHPSKEVERPTLLVKVAEITWGRPTRLNLLCKTKFIAWHLKCPIKGNANRAKNFCLCLI